MDIIYLITENKRAAIRLTINNPYCKRDTDHIIQALSFLTNRAHFQAYHDHCLDILLSCLPLAF
jgi:hypothetical protein